MKLRPYLEYKESGVGWLGQVPKEWTVTKIKHVASFTTGWTPPTGDSESYEGDNLWANISDLGPKVLYDTAKRVSNEAIKRTNISTSPKGSLLFSFKLSIGQVGFAGCNLYTNEAIATFLPDNEARLDYLYYASPVYIVENTSFNIYGAKLLNQELINSASIALPNQDGQRQIANFLDRETGKLDTLIAKQEHLIELLQEKRQAIISHAVTKGLNPEAKMKDSGVEWLGDVPAEWNVKPLKFIADLRLSNVDKHTVEGQSPVLLCNYVDVYKNERISKDIKFMSATASEEQIKRLSLVVGDVIITKDSEDPRDIGIPTYVAEILPDLVCGYHLALIRSNNETSGEFLYYFLKSRYAAASFEIEACGITRYAIGKYSIGNLDISTPPLAEQIRIANYLDLQTVKIDALIDKAKRSIELAKEHRTALISAAVTGKIDVRDYVNDLEAV